MRKSVHHRMLLGSGGTAGIIAVPDGPFLVEFCKTTTILGATLLSNDIIPNGATIISIQAFVGGTGVLLGGNVQWTQTSPVPTPSSFTYTIQDNVTAQIATATVTVTPFNATTACVDDGPSFDTTTEFRPLILSKFGGGTITANDTFGGAAPVNPVTVTVLTPSTPAYADLFDLSIPGIYTLIIPPGTNQIEIECWGAEGGLGGNLSAPGAAGPGQPNQVPGRGAHRLVSNLAVTPGQILSIAVGGQGSDAATVPGTGGGGQGGVGGIGFADNSTSGSLIQLDSFGFPDGANVSAFGGSGICTGCDGAGGAFGSRATSTNPATGAGGGGGAGSAVSVLDATISTGVPYNRLGPVLSCAGGGGGGSGARVIADTSRGPGQDGGPPDPEQIPSTSFYGSHGQTIAGAGATGGGGGGFRGGHSFPQVDFLGRRRGFGGESNDERYRTAGERFAGNKSPSINAGASQPWLAFSGSTTTEFASLQVGNGRVRIRGRTVVDQLGGTQFPVNCQVVDGGATITITPDIPFNAVVVNECSFFYFLTDTKTGETSGVCEVSMDIIANFIDAVNETVGATELIINNVAIATLLVNDTFTGTPVFTVVPGSAVNCTAIVVGANVQVTPVARSVSTTASFQYTITDPLMPVGFELLAGRGADTATVTVNINLPAPIVSPDGPGGLPNPVEDLGQSPASVNVPKATLLGNDSCGSQPCTFFSVGSTVRCTAVSSGANVVVTSTDPFTSGSTCTFQYRVQNAQGALSAFTTVTLDLASVSFVVSVDTGFHAGLPSSTRGNLLVPGGMTLMKTEVWGAAGGAGNGGVGAPGNGLKRESVSNVVAGQNIEFACGQRGTTGGAVSPIFGALNGVGGGIDISGIVGSIADGFFTGISCPLVTDGGVPVGGTNICVGGGGSTGQTNIFGGGGGGGAGSVVWFGAVPINNIINCSSGGGGGAHTGSGFGGGTSGSACGGQGRNMNSPFLVPVAGFGRGGGGGGFVGGDTSYSPDNAGGPGGGAGANTSNFLPASVIHTPEPTINPGRVIISFA